VNELAIIRSVGYTMSGWERTRGHFEEAWVNACLTPHEQRSDGSSTSNNSINDPGLTLRKLLVAIVRAWTSDRKGGVIVKNRSQTLFQAIEFYGPVLPPAAVDIQYCRGPQLAQARAFLRGEEIEEIECSDATAKQFQEHVLKSLRTAGHCDIGSGLILYEGRLQAISPPSRVANGGRGLSTSSSSATTNGITAAAQSPESSSTTPPTAAAAAAAVRGEICSRPGCNETKTSEGKKLLACSKCMALYCSPLCQRQDWKAHKLVCKK
jgi:MYND finger